MLRLAILFFLLTLAWPATAATVAIPYLYGDYRVLIGQKQAALPLPKVKKPYLGIISHHLPTASPLIDDFYGRLKKVRPDIKTFVIVSPDHFERCRMKAVTTDAVIQTMFGNLAPDRKLIEALVPAGIKKEVGCFRGEHGVGVQANYIKKFFPEARIVPILLSYSAKNKDFTNVAKVLSKNREGIFIVQSTDFTHYVDANTANVNDRTSEKLIRSLDGRSFTLKQVDSPGAIRLVLGLAKEWRLKSEFLGHKNSFDYDGSFRNTTSYFSVWFQPAGLLGL